jgi:hypothetical protein
MDDGKTRDFLGLPLWRPLYGFGDTLALRARMTNAFFVSHVDRRAIAGALPRHPKVKLHPASPLVVVQSDFLHCEDNADPQSNDYRYREIMLACLLEGPAGIFGPMWPLILFLDQPIAFAAGREFHGFPKVPAAVSLDEASMAVDFDSWPGGVRRAGRVMGSRWSVARGLVARALGAASGAMGSVLRAAHIDADTVDFVEQLAMMPMGEVWNLHQVPDLASPRRSTFNQLTRFKPTITEPGAFQWLSDFTLDLPSAAEDPVWSLGKRFLHAKEEPASRRALAAFTWEATMHVSGGEVLDTWR